MALGWGQCHLLSYHFLENVLKLRAIKQLNSVCVTQDLAKNTSQCKLETQFNTNLSDEVSFPALEISSTVLSVGLSQESLRLRPEL